MDAPPAQGNESEDTICSDLRERFEQGAPGVVIDHAGDTGSP